MGSGRRDCQPGAKGQWRTTPLVPSLTIAHHPEQCAACNADLEIDSHRQPYMGYYVLELEKQDSGLRVICQLHHYYGASCECGHQTKAMPGQGYISVVPGRSSYLQLQEYGLVGAMLASFIASLGVTKKPDIMVQPSKSTIHDAPQIP